MAPQDKDASTAVYLTSNLPVSSFNPSKISLSLRTALGPKLGKIQKILRATIVNTSNWNAVTGKAMSFNRNAVKGKAMNSNQIADNAASP